MCRVKMKIVRTRKAGPRVITAPVGNALIVSDWLLVWQVLIGGFLVLVFGLVSGRADAAGVALLVL